ncbi:hypothetical protein CRENBAI_004350 [Crenichthys baileyi]|uniref:Uncharacterized protein n=1 Tax=Crenichthys baileyi TaxID=28760 RepID=A0AAV9S8B1_9TELE
MHHCLGSELPATDACVLALTTVGGLQHATPAQCAPSSPSARLRCASPSVRTKASVRTENLEADTPPSIAAPQQDARRKERTCGTAEHFSGEHRPAFKCILLCTLVLHSTPQYDRSHLDQARKLQREFKKGEITAKLFSHLTTSPSSPWRRKLVANTLKNWLEEWGGLFPQDPLTHFTIEPKRQKALGEISASMRRLPAPSSARLSTEGWHDAAAPASRSRLHSLSDPVPERLEGESLPDPVPEQFKDEPLPDSVPVPEELEDELPLLPVSVPSPILEGSEDEPPLHPVPDCEGFGDGLPPLPVPVPEGFGDELHQSAEPQKLRGRCPEPRRDLHPTASLSMAGLLTTCSEGPLLCPAGLPAFLLDSESRLDALLAARDDLSVVLLNSVSGRDDLRAVCLNSVSARTNSGVSV